MLAGPDQRRSVDDEVGRAGEADPGLLPDRAAAAVAPGEVAGRDGLLARFPRSIRLAEPGDDRRRAQGPDRASSEGDFFATYQHSVPALF